MIWDSLWVAGAWASFHGWTDPVLALAERTSSPPGPNSPAWGCGLQDQYPHFHSECRAAAGGAGETQEAMGLSSGTPTTPTAPFLPRHPYRSSVHTSRWQQRCWKSCAGRWASRTPRKCRSLPSSSSKGTVNHPGWGESMVQVDSATVALREAVPTPGAGKAVGVADRAVGGAWQGRGRGLVLASPFWL